MTKLKIQEIIVVEGKDDTRRLQEVVDADTIETIGSAINEGYFDANRTCPRNTRGHHLHRSRFFGRKNSENDHGSRATSQTCILPRKQARPRKQGSLGVEHASDEAILEALKRS